MKPKLFVTLFVTLFVAVVLMLALAAFLPSQAVQAREVVTQAGVAPVLDLWQLYLVGAAASLLVAAVNWLAKAKTLNWFGKVIDVKPIHIGRFWLTLMVVLSAFGLAFWWFPFSLPACPDMSGLTFADGFDKALDYGGVLVKAISPYVGAAVLVYNLLLSYLTDPVKRKQLWQEIKVWFMRRLGVPIPEVPF